MDQTTLFGSGNDSDDKDICCKFPYHTASTAYRYGCRCDRCREYHRTANQKSALGLCNHKGCNKPKVARAYARYCEKHDRSKCRYEGCNNFKRLGQGVAYCIEHATMVDGVLLQQTIRLKDFKCDHCQAHVQRATKHSVRTKYKLCSLCNRKFGKFAKQCNKHGVPAELFHTWISDMRCALCSRDVFYGAGSMMAVIDHDHSHCHGRTGCSQCIRGLLCNSCNTQLGAYESLMSKVDTSTLADYLAR